MMQGAIKFDKKDEIVMNLLHYFVTEQNYNPVIVHGVSDEIWLENMGQDYKIVRIVSKYIHNNEQLKYDEYKCHQITKKLKMKTMSLKMRVLNIYIDLGDSVDLIDNDKNFSYVSIKQDSDVKKKAITDVFPDMPVKLEHKEQGIELFVKITNDINRKNMENSTRISRIFSKKKPIITYVLMGICLVAFLAMEILGNGSNDSQTLLRFGANLDILVKSGDYYRLLTAVFLHIGILHLVCNMYALYIIGPQIESFFGKWKYLLIFIVSGISGNLLSMAFSHNIISAGASGAIFGLLGAMLYFGYNYRSYLGNVMRSQIIPIIVLNLFFGFISTGIDNFAHIGGLIGGILAAMAVGVPDKTRRSDRINGVIVTVIYLVFIGYLAFVGI